MVWETIMVEQDLCIIICKDNRSIWCIHNSMRNSLKEGIERWRLFEMDGLKMIFFGFKFILIGF